MLVTRGMAKLGFPELEIRDLPTLYVKPMSTLINAVVQMLIERPELGREGALRVDLGAIRNRGLSALLARSTFKGAKRIGVLQLGAVREVEGVRTATISPAAGRGSATQRFDRLLSQIFGTSQSPVEHVIHDAELRAAAARARALLPALRKRFAAGLSGLETISVKAPFWTAGGEREWMWIEVTHWSGTKIQGVLANDPTLIEKLYAGSLVAVEQADVVDYLHVKPNGSRKGNLITQILLERAKKRTP